jgi:hypothetical protein
VLALLYSAGAAAQENKAAPCDLGRNAALSYWRAFAAFPEMTKEEELVVAYSGRSNEPKSTPEQRADLVKRWDRALAFMHEATDIPQCNWGIDYEKEGPNVDLTYLGKARQLARAAAFRARWLWGEGKRKEAAEDLRATVIMARQIGNDGHDTMIAMLVQIAIENIADNSLAALLADRESADLFANALGDLVNGPAAPLTRNAVFAEKNFFMPWFRRKYSSDPVKALADLSDMDSHLVKLLEGSPKTVPQLLDDAEKRYDDFARLNALPFQEFMARKQAFEEKIKSSDNPFAVTLLPAMMAAREEEEKYRVRWAMVRAGIAIRREGEAALSKVLNPADGKPFLYMALEGGAFELKSALPIRDTEVSLTFGRPPAKQ